MKIPNGSAWIVLPYHSPSIKKLYHDDLAAGRIAPFGITGRRLPTGNVNELLGGFGPDARDYSRTPYMDIDPGTVILVGSTIPDTDTILYPYAEWVEVIFPTRCYINRVHFNSDSEMLLRVG